MYTTFEEEATRKLVRGRSLSILEYDKILDRLVQHARTVYGRERCYTLLPTSDLELVEGWQQETQDTLTFLVKEGTLPLGGVNDIRDAVKFSDTGATLTMKHLLNIAQFLRTVERLAQVKPENIDLDPSTHRLLAELKLLVPLTSLEKEISSAITGENEMNDRASNELYAIRRQIRDAQSSIREILERLIRKNPQALQDQLVTIRDGRYCVPVRPEKKSEVPGVVHDTSASGQTLFIEPMAVVELNNKIREWTAAEQEEINRILGILSGKVAISKNELLMDIELVGHIDFMQAKAQFALELDASRPIMNQDGRIVLHRARHPLIDKERVVPIDFSVGTDYRTLVITGPNTGGKTVSLKTCGLITLMAMAGLFIPCLENSEVSTFTKVLADIGDEQSIEQSLSTFSAHMTNLVQILKLTKKTSLVLVDELGSGTDPTEGAALAIAILDECRKKGAVTVATTHYKELKAYAVEQEGVENACCEFDTETLSPTYRLMIGLPGVSNAFVISRKLGLSPSIIEAAQSILSEESLKVEELLSSAERHNRESEKIQQEMADLKDQIQKQSEDLEVQRKQIEKERKRVLAQAREEKREMLEEVLEKADTLLDEIKELQKMENSHEAERKVRAIRNNLRAGLSDIDAEEGADEFVKEIPGEKPDKIREGGLYYSPKLDVTGIILKGPDSKGNCILSSGSLKLTVPADSLRYPKKEEVKRSAPQDRKTARKSNVSRADSLRMAKKSAMMPEIQLLGMTVDEACSALDRYLDDCVLSNISDVRIVHGKGTGALRAAVDQFLKKDRRVRSYRLGTFGEGEDGVTIAELK
ncbi:MAG: endonuclease MutS2 [Clostridiales bacterium]|nr:endonuclease MutS2 [Candidatus Scatonaster coprocaballi]